MQIDAASFLKEIFAERSSNNSRYSLRAFAKSLGLSPGGLSQILNRKTKLSMDRAHELVQRLQLNAQDADRFLTLVELNGTSNPLRKVDLIRKLEGAQDSAANLAVDHFHLISAWYGLALLVLVSETPGPFTFAGIAKRLGISAVEAETMLNRLVRLELIEMTEPKSQKFEVKRIHETVMVTNSEFTPEATIKYYRELQDKTAESLSEQGAKTRVSGAQVFTLDPKHISKARTLTNKYLDDLEKLSTRDKATTEVFQAVTHIYQITKQRGSKI